MSSNSISEKQQRRSELGIAIQEVFSILYDWSWIEANAADIVKIL